MKPLASGASRAPLATVVSSSIGSPLVSAQETFYLLLEDGSYFLLEDGSKLILENG